MTASVVLDIYKDALLLVVMLVAVIVTPSLLVGLVVATFQAATSINEQTMSFLPRLLVTLSTIMIMGPWLLQKILDYAHGLIVNIPNLIG